MGSERDDAVSTREPKRQDCILDEAWVMRHWPRDETDVDAMMVEDASGICASHEALRAEIERLRAALRRILTDPSGYVDLEVGIIDVHAEFSEQEREWLSGVARAVLGDTDEPPDGGDGQ